MSNPRFEAVTERTRRMRDVTGGFSIMHVKIPTFLLLFVLGEALVANGLETHPPLREFRAERASENPRVVTVSWELLAVDLEQRPDWRGFVLFSAKPGEPETREADGVEIARGQAEDNGVVRFSLRHLAGEDARVYALAPQGEGDKTGPLFPGRALVPARGADLAAPTGVRLELRGDDARLAWEHEHPADSHFAGFVVSRSVDHGEYKPLNERPLLFARRFYFDPGITREAEGKWVSYTVTAVSGDQRLDAPSLPASLQLPRRPPEAPTALRATHTLNDEGTPVLDVEVDHPDPGGINGFSVQWMDSHTSQWRELGGVPATPGKHEVPLRFVRSGPVLFRAVAVNEGAPQSAPTPEIEVLVRNWRPPHQVGRFEVNRQDDRVEFFWWAPVDPTILGSRILLDGEVFSGDEPIPPLVRRWSSRNVPETGRFEIVLVDILGRTSEPRAGNETGIRPKRTPTPEPQPGEEPDFMEIE